ncbi:endonuclease/exonuclease/phosphatase family protein [Chitinophaga niabensis]|uniref:Concanavalin A-like lectin/glucanases superfamily protein n=1 Tax=Chitinophaga niabensis TaxID=536979 RepID=A0A1N6EL68_9BACT|nr:endonuclease/exonuclease/phosphatase family protein [Chitinophaga niabensis]SIN83725.1 Concanavalin A-like lectin/glucanases superfamily protein [Chitinophaga niabensis]
MKHLLILATLCLSLPATAQVYKQEKIVLNGKPLEVQNPLGTHKGGFTAVLWVKAAEQGSAAYEILGTKRWQIGVQENGAWYWKAGNYEYRPTPQRQGIRDGRTHMLAFAYDTLKKETTLYYDGKNVAIYYTPGLDSLNASALNIGGVAKGELGEWETFYGEIPELTLYSSSAENIAYLYSLKVPPPRPMGPPKAPAALRVMNYNIWHGGNETGKETGPQRIVEIIQSSGADIVSMQETYGSGAKIADALGYYFYLRSTNLSIMSRYPITETLEGDAPFYNGGAYIKISDQQKIAFFTNWLNYPYDYWDMLEKNRPINPDSLAVHMEKGNTARLRSILKTIQPHTANADKIPVLFCGDFNTGSHLDWINATKEFNNGYTVRFPAGLALYDAGYKDAFRIVHPDPLKERGITWTPQFPHAFQDRIDYIYYKGALIQPVKAWTITTHPVKYPSDHAALVVEFKVLPK